MPTLAELAQSVRYVGSGEHKRFPNPLCPPSLRTDASDCDAVDPTLSQDPARVSRALQLAIARGQVDPVSEGGFPRRAWGRLRLANGADELFEARLTNQATGEYKGYFVEWRDRVGKRSWLRAKLSPGGPWHEVIP